MVSTGETIEMRIPVRTVWWQGRYAVERYSAERRAWEVVDSDDDVRAVDHDAHALHRRHGYAYRAVEQATGVRIATYGVAS